MIQLGLILALVTSILGGGVYLVGSIRDQGRAECRAEHAEASRMAELRQRERGQSVAKKFEHDKREIQGRDEEARKAVAGSDRNCVSDSVRDALNERIRQGRTAPGADNSVSPSKGD